MPPVITTHDLVKRFGALAAVDGVTLAVEAGTTYGLLGPSGCGKSTLIRLLTGLARPTSGAISVLGGRPKEPATRARLGYMPQAAALYGELSLRANIAFFADLYDVREAGRIDELLTLVELKERADTAAAQASGGMRQRASLACALVHRPDVLFLDEPTVGVDPRLRAAFWSYFRRLNEQGVTIIISSHIMDEAARCDRLGLMRAGQIIAEGSVTDICRAAGADTLEAAFLALAGAKEDER